MAEYIVREAVIDRFKALGLGEYSFMERAFADGVYHILENFPRADVAPVAHGRWEPFGGRYYSRKKCSRCGWDGQEWVKFYKYCPNCGARMDGE